VSAYALDGARVWHRGDLKKVQHISPVFEDAEGRPALALGLERGSLVIVNPETGRTRSQVKGAKVLYAGPRGARLLRLKGAVRLEAGTPLQVHRVPLQSFSVLAASFSQEDVAFSEAGGNLRCYSLSGTPRWEANVGRGSKAHALEVAWNERHQLWLAVVSNFTAGGLWLVRIDARGEEVSRVPLAPLAPHCLAPSGDILGTGDGCVVEPLSNATLFRFLPEPAAPMRVVRKETP
jgi:hypothetical protein